MFGVLQGRIPEQRPQGSESDVAGSGAVVAVSFEVPEECADRVEVEGVPVKEGREIPAASLDDSTEFKKIKAARYRTSRRAHRLPPVHGCIWARRGPHFGNHFRPALAC